MAERNEKIRYASGSTYGSVAYDLRTVNVEYDGNAVRKPEPKVKAEPKAKVSTQPAAVEASKQGVSLFAVVSFVAVVALAIMVLMAYVNLTAVKAETAKLKSEITALETEKNQLLIKYENEINMDDVRDYAVNVLGMRAVTDDQITILSSGRTDKAVILKNTDGAGFGFLDKMSTFLTSVLEYFD